MKRTTFVLLTILVVFVTVLAVLVVRPVRTVKAHQGCSNRTLFGDYGGTISGQIQGPASGPVTLVGLLKFDGNSALSGSEGYNTAPDTAPPHSFINSGPGSSWTGGTYEVLSDCSFTATIPGTPAATLQGVVVNADGSEVIGEVFIPTTITPVPPCPSCTPPISGNPGNAGMGIFDLKKVSNFE